MRNKKLIFPFISIFSFLVSGSGSYTNSLINKNINKREVIKPGFKFERSYYNHKSISTPTGYFTFKLNIYSTNFTEVSKLFLLEFYTIFTSGSIACINNEPGFDDHYDLYTGYVHRRIKGKEANSNNSSVNIVATWPQSSTYSITYASSYGGNLNMGNEFSYGVNLSELVSIKRASNLAIQLNCNYSTAISTTEPVLSNQFSPSNPKESQWSYHYEGLIKASYHLDSFYLIEVRNNGFNNSYSFTHDFDILMSNVAWKNWLWEQHKETKIENEILNLRFY